MVITDIIEKKKNGLKLTKEEIEFFINGYVDGSVADYQASSLLMAICIRGMDRDETVDLTLAMRDSGDKVDLSAIDAMVREKALEKKISLITLPEFREGAMGKVYNILFKIQHR